MKLKKKQIIKLMQWLIAHEELENTSGISEHTAKCYLKEFMETQETVKLEQKPYKIMM